MKMTIGKKLFLGFGAMIVVIAIISIIGIKESLEVKNFSDVEMSRVMHALDGAMETRINYLHVIWGTLEAASSLDELSQQDALKEFEEGVKGFSESIAALKKSGVIEKTMSNQIESNFTNLTNQGKQLLNGLKHQIDIMKKLDTTVVELIDNGIERKILNVKQVNLIWAYAMAVNDFAAYLDPEVETEIKTLNQRINSNIALSGDMAIKLNKITSIGDDLVATVTKKGNILKKFNEFAKNLDKIMEVVEDGGNGKEGADAFAERLLKELSIAASTGLNFLIITMIIGVLVAFVIAFLLANNIGKLLKTLINDLGDSAEQLSAASQEISDSSQQLSEGSTEQAATLEETSSSMEEIASQSKENADNATTAATSMESVAATIKQSAESAKTAASLAEDARAASELGASEMGTISKAMKDIRDGSDKITDIIEVINEITHQTKMLATNAAIEAARAGDQGKGFAVVADEVSKLAENSKTAAKEIAGLIKNSAREAHNGSELAEKGEKALNEILNKSVKLADLVNEISTSAEEEAKQVDGVENLVNNIKNASNEQANGVDQVTRAINEMDKITQTNAANAEETASASEELASQAQMLQGLVQEVSTHVGGMGSNSLKVQVGSSRTQYNISKPASNFKILQQTKKSIGSLPAVPAKNLGKQIKPTDVIPMRDDFKEF